MDGVEDIIEVAKERFTNTLAHYDEEYRRGEEDVEFANGEQWSEAEKKRRADDSRPALTENRCMPFIEQIVNGARETRPSVRVAPIDDKGDQDTAEVFKGLIRNIERQSKASVAYDMGVQNAVSAGYGWIRIGTDYTDPLSFTQDIRIESVADWKSVMLDPASEMIDGSDAEYGFIYKDIEKDTFKKTYPDKEPTDFEGTSPDNDDDIEKVRIVEYFYKQYEETEITEVFLADGSTKVLTKAQLESLPAEEIIEVLQERKTKLPTVKWCKLYGGGKLEETEWLGQYIPLIPVYGKLVWRDGRLKAYSLITHAKDPQRMLNVIKTTIAEVVGSQPKNQPWVGAKGQFETDDRWDTANVENYASLEYDMKWVTDEDTGQSMLAPPPQKAQPIQVSPALFQIEANASLGINSALGMYEEGRGDESNAISGVAIKSRQIRGDKATFHFIDNLACSIRHVGVILVDLIPKIYNRDQVLRIVGNDDKEKTIQITQEGQTDKTQGIYNLNAGKYDVDVDVGASYATQQQEFLNIMLELLRVNPELAAIAGDKIVEASGGAYADVISERIRANMPPEMQSDDPMATKLLEVMKQLEASKQEQEMLMAALDDKKKNEALEGQIKTEEVKIKGFDAQTKRLDVLADVEEKRLKAQGAESEALADISEAIIELHDEIMVMKQNAPVSPNNLIQAQQANNPPEGVQPQ